MLAKTLFLSVALVLTLGAFCSEAAVIGRSEPSLDRVKRQNAVAKDDDLMKQFIWTPGVAASVKDGMETQLQAQSPAECASRCAEKGRAECLSFEYVKVRKTCLLKKGNSYTVGLRLRLEASSDFYELREELKPQLMKPKEEESSVARAKSEPNRVDPSKPEKKAESGGRRAGGKNRGKGKGRNRGKERNRQDEDVFLRKQLGERERELDDTQQTTPAMELTTPAKEMQKLDIVPTTIPTPAANKQPAKEDRKKKGGKKREKGKKRKDGKRKGKGGKGKKRNGKEDNNRVASKFKEGGVIPDVLDNPPEGKAEVKFDDVRVSLGKTLTPTDTKNEPKVTWPAEDGQLYTLAMLDPDSPSRADPRYGQWKHWLVGNIPGNDVRRGDVISEYISPIPLVGTGLHRYVILVYKQTKRLDFDEPRQTSITARGRGLWKVRAFAEKYELGDPVAGNFFEAEWDKWVPKVYDQLATKRKK
ncbi:PEBP1 [Branchiostoma lanceolatum]|uniref:PEBP1 protein n=1 Tax=Branchiostoma lanceolatum TaxID=7740 RepID=A0A8J9ZBZ7_BRALA|nr:PEBP1 [Branchiostoma lanceolatum]